jgi:RimJ/RimL family protein N-acetyltransferase
MILSLALCTLRPYEDGDVASIARNANDRGVWRNMRDQFPHPYGEDEARTWIALNQADPAHRNLAIVVDGEAVGGIGIIPQQDVFSRSAEIGYWLGAAYRGRGVATAAVSGLSDRLFATTSLVRLFAGVFEPNRASARVLEKAGYTLEGRLRKAVYKDGELLDQLLYARVFGA